jgi:hypothetical protein
MIRDSGLDPRARLLMDGRQDLASRDLACTVPYPIKRPTVGCASGNSKRIP